MKPPKWTDISVAVAPEKTPTWPGSPRISFTERLSLRRGDAASDTTITMSAHTGTHIDAPSHFVAGAGDIDQVALGPMIGPCWIASCEGAAKIDAQVLENASIPAGIERILLKTDNHRLWSADFDRSYVALDSTAASWLVDRGVALVGIDYLSIQAFDESDQVHIELLEAAVVILEGLDLSQVQPGPYELMCLPLKLEGVEAAPARALVRPLQQH